MRNFYSTLILISFTALGYSQTQNNAVPKSKENLLAGEYSGVQSAEMQLTSKSVNSYYFGFDNQIAALMQDDKIPATFPKQQTNQTKDDYIATMNKWIADNSKFIKEGSKNFKFNNNQ